MPWRRWSPVDEEAGDPVVGRPVSPPRTTCGGRCSAARRGFRTGPTRPPPRRRRPARRAPGVVDPLLLQRRLPWPPEPSRRTSGGSTCTSSRPTPRCAARRAPRTRPTCRDERLDRVRTTASPASPMGGERRTISGRSASGMGVRAGAARSTAPQRTTARQPSTGGRSGPADAGGEDDAEDAGVVRRRTRPEQAGELDPRLGGRGPGPELVTAGGGGVHAAPAAGSGRAAGGRQGQHLRTHTGSEVAS